MEKKHAEVRYESGHHRRCGGRCELRHASAQIGRECRDRHPRARGQRLLRQLRLALLCGRQDREGGVPHRGEPGISAGAVQHRRQGAFRGGGHRHRAQDGARERARRQGIRRALRQTFACAGCRGKDVRLERGGHLCPPRRRGRHGHGGVHPRKGREERSRRGRRIHRHRDGGESCGARSSATSWKRAASKS